jgi:hypothetical protein
MDMKKIGILASARSQAGMKLARDLLRRVGFCAQESSTRRGARFRAGATAFGIFDTFADEAGRKGHLEGRIAQALLGRADELLASPPDLRMIDLLAVK